MKAEGKKTLPRGMTKGHSKKVINANIRKLIKAKFSKEDASRVAHKYAQDWKEQLERKNNPKRKGTKMKKHLNPISASTGSIVVVAAVAAGFYFWWKNRPVEQRIVASLNPSTVRKLMSDLDASAINSSVAIPNASQDWMTA